MLSAGYIYVNVFSHMDTIQKRDGGFLKFLFTKAWDI